MKSCRWNGKWKCRSETDLKTIFFKLFNFICCLCIARNCILLKLSFYGIGVKVCLCDALQSKIYYLYINDLFAINGRCNSNIKEVVFLFDSLLVPTCLCLKLLFPLIIVTYILTFIMSCLRILKSYPGSENGKLLSEHFE